MYIYICVFVAARRSQQSDHAFYVHAYLHAHVHIYISHGHAAPHKQGIDQPQGVHSPHSTRLLRQTRRHLLQRQGVCVRVPA